VSVRDKVRDLARLSRYAPSTSASVGRCPRTHQQLRTGSDGQTVLRAFGATQVTVPVVQEAAGSPGGERGSPWGGRGSPGGGHPPPERQTRVRRTGVAADGHTGEGRCVGRRVGAPALHRGGGAHSALQSRLGPDHHYVKLRIRCKKKLLFTPRIRSGELSYFLIFLCMSISRASGERSYFLAYSCVLSRNGIAPYRELTLLVHRANVKSVDEMQRIW
jgi:hypothetical protein